MKLLISVLFFLLPLTGAYAGPHYVGNGGMGVFCNENGKVSKIQLLDLVEGVESAGYQMLPRKDGESFGEALFRVRSHMRRDLPEIEKILEPYVNKILEKKILSHIIHRNTHDTFPFMADGNSLNCGSEVQFIQIATYTRAPSRGLTIRADVWTHPGFSALDKVALIYHEAIYAYFRRSIGATRSFGTRLLVQTLFSLEPVAEKRDRAYWYMRLKQVAPKNDNSFPVSTK